ncbi:MAG TPA: HlyC/CorC family transporter [Kiloniellales bacterium]|nr:HlyC/CorC family transporter [Kiloniellales bacterium]
MDSALILTTIAILVLMILSGFFSGSETALTAASRPRMHRLLNQGDKRAEAVHTLWERKERLIGAILLGNNLVNILASALATSLLISLVGEAGVAYATLLMTALVLIFSEVLPKTLALYHADRFALFVARPIQVVVLLLSPVVQVVQWFVALVLRSVGAGPSSESDAERWEEELRGAIDLHQGEDDEEVRHEREMMRSILDLADVEVADIMVHRRNVLTINVDEKPEDLMQLVMNSPYTRLPLWRQTPENIVGVLHVKALFRAVQAAEGDVSSLDVMAIAGKPWFIPDSTDLLSQLQAFRARKEHIAIVVDEYGEMLGIVTLEDILEEIVGDISDETDIGVEGVDLLQDGTAIVAGTVTIRDLNRRCDWRLPDEEASTIAGLVLHEARLIPDVGQTFSFHGFRFEILGRQRNQITLLKITPLSDEEKEAETATS